MTTSAGQALSTELVRLQDGTDLETAEFGTGEPLVLVCGTSQDLRLWAPLLPTLSASRRVITYNHRGIGASTRGAGAMSVRSLADDLNALLSALRIERADLIGWSLGSAVLQEFALAQPDRVRALVLVATWGRTSPFQRAVLAGLRHPWSTGDRDAALTALSIAYSEDLVNSDAFGPMMEAMLPLFPSTDTQVATVVEQWDADLDHDSLDRLGDISARTLVVAAERDLLTPPGEGRKVAEAIPGARYELFTGPGASHAVLLERAADFLALVAGFLNPAATGNTG